MGIIDIYLGRKRALANECISKAQNYDAEAAEIAEEVNAIMELKKENGLLCETIDMLKHDIDMLRKNIETLEKELKDKK